ncbi:hypothetical protein SAMN05443665_101116 [Actinomadura meyerae]|uniref:CU044_5270 family protein n=1 Tax=Actinomadura meyerae TaxID=240840 RepID=A0A239HYB7_9ACTN|nr:CU044_5270 family protein [Actinomadura meyerae]SNS86192.1 hypothetical protein SAMN05443665_101116 [Actinomadura meyerae]
MNATQSQRDSGEHEELARLLPGPAERDLPSDRHQRLKEFVMSQIQEDLRSSEQAPRRRKGRRPVVLVSALTAAATATAAVVVLGMSGSEDSRAGSDGRSTASAAASPSGQQILLVAATTAERTPAGSGTYWYVKTTYTKREGGARISLESWTRRDGRVWWKGAKTQGKVVRLATPAPFRLGGAAVSVEQLDRLPTEPEALQGWIADAVKRGGVTTSAGRADAKTRERSVFDGLVSLVSQLPSPPKARSAAFRALASYPEVKNLGPVKGGQGLTISLGKGEVANLVLDPKTSRITDTDYFVSADGAQVTAPGGATIVAQWTNRPPK